MINTAGPIGIDLCDDAVRLLQLSSAQGSLRVISSARIDLGRLGLKHDPNDPAPDELVRAVAARVQAGGFKGKRCVITLPDLSLEMRTARLPVMNDSELASAVALDAPAHLGLQDEEDGAQIGWLRTGEVFQGEERRIELVYFGTGTRRLEQLVDAFGSAGLETVALEPRFVSLTRAATRFLRRAADAETVQIATDICEQHSEVLITKGAGLVFAKTIPVGAQALNDAIEQRLGLDAKTVRELRRQRMDRREAHAVEDRVEQAMFDAVRPILTKIAHETSLCLRHYSVTFRGSRPSRALLVGANAHEPGLDRVMSETLGITAQQADPLEGVATDLVVGGGPYCPAWTAAIGVATRDLLKAPSSRKRNQRRSTVPQAGQEQERAA